jgi:hypothetical protein
MTSIELLKQILQNKSNEINSWAIFWYATIFLNKGLCLNPSKTFVLNIGHDGSGVHCDINSNFNDHKLPKCCSTYVISNKKTYFI